MAEDNPANVIEAVGEQGRSVSPNLGPMAVAGAELDQVQERTEFIDSRGQLRRAHELAADVIITDQLEQVIDERFENVYDELPKIDTELDTLEEAISNPEEFKSSLFNPLGDEFIARIKDRVNAQVELVTEERPVTKTIQTEKRSMLGRKKLVASSVEATERVVKEGQVTKISGEDKLQITERARWFKYKDETEFQDRRRVITRSRDEEKQQLEDKITDAAERLLCGDVDQTDTSALPLLAVRLAEAGVQVDDITPDKLLELVPELSFAQEAIEQVREITENEVLTTAMGDLRSRLFDILPLESLAEITQIYYTDTELTEIQKRYERLYALHSQRFPDRVDHYQAPDEFVGRARQNIEEFFTHTQSADELLFHYTPFGPRLIKSGALKPSASMSEAEFSFNTLRRHGHSSQEGSNGVHWSQRNNLYYHSDSRPGHWVGDSALRPDELAREQAKGGFGHMVMAVRLGDVVRRTRFGGWRDISDESTRTDPRGSTSEFVTVQLTEEGFKKVADKIDRQAKSNDIVYVAATSTASKKEAFDYEYPLDDMLIAVGSRSQDQIAEAMRAAGRLDEDIADQIYVYEGRLGGSDTIEQMQADADKSGKYSRSVVARLKNHSNA